jgi:hypothetical protein
MMAYFQTRAEQDAAIKKLLNSIGNSTKTYRTHFIESIDPSDHEITVALLCGLVDYWIDGNTFMIRLSDVGRDWLATH